MEKNDLKHPCELLIIGGSAGGLDVLLEVLPKLKTSISFPIVIVLHRKNTQEETLTALMSIKATLPVKEIEDKEPIQESVIYIAPADYHLLIEKSHYFALDYSEKVNFSRPSIDVTFESAADVYGASLVCIVLSGANNDGTQGAKAVKEKGGVVAAQQPETAVVPFMPDFMIKNVQPQHVLNIPQLIQFINSLGNRY
jgi:two-component system chemotaxis response regulator CheB